MDHVYRYHPLLRILLGNEYHFSYVKKSLVILDQPCVVCKLEHHPIIQIITKGRGRALGPK